MLRCCAWPAPVCGSIRGNGAGTFRTLGSLRPPAAPAEAKYKKTCFLDGEECVLDILDTAGQDEYLQMLDQVSRPGRRRRVSGPHGCCASFGCVAWGCACWAGEQWIRECSGYILVYAVDDETSLARLVKIREKIQRVREGQPGPIPM